LGDCAIRLAIAALGYRLNAPIMIPAMRRCRNVTIPNGIAQSGNRQIVDKSSIVSYQSPMDRRANPFSARSFDARQVFAI
jgi:hypothetical protein